MHIRSGHIFGKASFTPWTLFSEQVGNTAVNAERLICQGFKLKWKYYHCNQEQSAKRTLVEKKWLLQLYVGECEWVLSEENVWWHSTSSFGWGKTISDWKNITGKFFLQTSCLETRELIPPWRDWNPLQWEDYFWRNCYFGSGHNSLNTTFSRNAWNAW